MTLEYKNAFMNLMRKHVADPANRTKTLVTDTFTANGTDSFVTLSNSSIVYIDEIKVNGVTQQIIRDYEIYFGKARTEVGKIFFTTKPTIGDTITVKYYYGINWIYFGYPQVDAIMPRIGMMARDGQMVPAGFGDVEHFTYPTINVLPVIRSGVEYTVNGKVYSGERLIDFISNEIRKAIVLIRRNAEMGYLITMNYNGDEQMEFDEQPDLIAKSIAVTAQFQWNYP